jgi:hypothetical protein
MFSNAGIFHERYNHIGSAEVILLGIKIRNWPTDDYMVSLIL